MTNDCNYGKQFWAFDDVSCLIDEFMELYEKRPIEDNRGGMLSPHLFWAWYIVRKLRPKNIIESGVYKGQGTWIFRQAHPEINIFSIDPALCKRVYIDKKANYFKEDFSLIDWTKLLNPKETLVFFDDHQNAYSRLQQMKWMGFTQAMFEDNYPVSQGDCYSLNKIFSEKGFIDKGKVIIPPNTAHAEFVRNNIDNYTIFPPLHKPDKTRWGDEWDPVNYPTPPAVFSFEDADKYPAIINEAHAYTWICYVKLKEMDV